MEQFYDLLLKNPLFTGVARADIASLLTCLSATLRLYRKQEFILLAGEPAGAVGIVCAGGVQVFKEDFTGNRTILAGFGAGEMFGEAFACAKIEELPVSVTAVSASKVLFIDYRKIITICSSACAFHNRLVENMLSVLASKNVVLNQKIEVLSKRTTREKLIAYLSEQARRADSRRFSIPFNRQELADYLCVDRSAMSSELSKMRGEGLLDFDRSVFELRDLP